MKMNSAIARKLEADEVHVRLLNWGRWLRYDSTYARLGYPSQAPFLFTPRKGALIASLDAQYIEDIVSDLYVSGLERPEEWPKNLLYAFILRVEYAEKPEALMGTVADRAKDVRKRFRRPCAESTYYGHLANAKIAVSMLSGPMR